MTSNTINRLPSFSGPKATQDVIDYIKFLEGGIEVYKAAFIDNQFEISQLKEKNSKLKDKLKQQSLFRSL